MQALVPAQPLRIDVCVCVSVCAYGHMCTYVHVFVYIYILLWVKNRVTPKRLAQVHGSMDRNLRPHGYFDPYPYIIYKGNVTK